MKTVEFPVIGRQRDNCKRGDSANARHGVVAEELRVTLKRVRLRKSIPISLQDLSFSTLAGRARATTVRDNVVQVLFSQ